MSALKPLTPEEWIHEHMREMKFVEWGDVYNELSRLYAELKRLTERAEKAEARERWAVTELEEVAANGWPELERLTKERDEWRANAEAAELVAERQRERAKSAERERDAHRAAAEKAERAAAAMREALLGLVRDVRLCVSCESRINNDVLSLAYDAGREFLSREEVRQIVGVVWAQSTSDDMYYDVLEAADAQIDEVIKERGEP